MGGQPPPHRAVLVPGALIPRRSADRQSVGDPSSPTPSGSPTIESTVHRLHRFAQIRHTGIQSRSWVSSSIRVTRAICGHVPLLRLLEDRRPQMTRMGKDAKKTRIAFGAPSLLLLSVPICVNLWTSWYGLSHQATLGLRIPPEIPARTPWQASCLTTRQGRVHSTQSSRHLLLIMVVPRGDICCG